MGCGVVLIWHHIVAELTREALLLLLTGGFFYIFGIIFFILGEYRPIYHTVWHIFVVIGAVVHWFDIYFFILQVNFKESDLIGLQAKAVVTDIVGSVSDIVAAATITSVTNITSTLLSAAANMTNSIAQT